MAVSVRITLNEQTFRRMNQAGGMVERGVQRAAGRVRDNAIRIITQEGQVDSGLLRQSGRSEQIRSDTNGIFYRVSFSAHSETGFDYALAQHQGVPGPIVPRRAKVLRFIPKGGSTYVFARSVSGFTGTKYLTRALDQLNVSDFTT